MTVTSAASPTSESRPAGPAARDRRPAVTGTYRLQLHRDFTFDDAAAEVPYLARLGVSHVYLSPVLAAAPGSAHGYDVLDHGRVDAERGGREGLERLATACQRHGLGVVVDIVPNHMALVAPHWHNQVVWEVLAEGRHAARAHWFDVDWAALDGQLGMPVLGHPVAEELRAGALVLDTGRPDEGPAAGEPVVRYYDHVFPVAAGTAPEGWDGSPDSDAATLAAVLGHQHYRLAGWRERDRVLNYRRFFEIDQLIGIRVEEHDVFESSHRLLLDLHHAGVIDGFRVDHPDGLADPQGYLAELARHCRPGTPVWVEKILEGEERLPTGWECEGTTGYDANAALEVALVPPATVTEVDLAWEHAGGEPVLGEVVASAKREAVGRLLVPEVDRLLRRATEALPDHDEAALREALEMLLAAVDVYRCYVRPGHETDADSLARLDEAIEEARARVADPAAVTALGAALRDPDGVLADPVAARDLAVRFQQTTGPVMAKGIEDTAFYRWHRLTALNEVGADPASARRPGPDRLQAWAAHQAKRWPEGLTTLSTHDTKRTEDVRARLLAAATDGASWRACTEAFAAAAAEHGVDGPTAHLTWQTVLGADGIDAPRLTGYLTKAIREAKQHTSWTEQDPDYEERVLGLARAALEEPALRRPVAAALEATRPAARALVLAQKLLQLTLPGVPDVYQGCELATDSLVDPDNRRPVDYAVRQQRLAQLDEDERPADLSDEKLLVTSRALRLRARHRATFGPGSGCQPVQGAGLLGLLRTPPGDAAAPQVAALTRLPWTDAPGREDPLPAGRWVDELTGRRVVTDGSPPDLEQLLPTPGLPVALLVAEPGRGA